MSGDHNMYCSANKPAGYYCVVCQRYLEADEYGVIVHDDLPHPENMAFDDDDNPQ